MKKNLTRKESDSLGKIDVPADRYFGAQTMRALHYLHIGAKTEIMPIEIIHALAIIKKAAAIVNQKCNILPRTKAKLIIAAAEEVISGKLDNHFPLHVWQSGSGTQTNMNVNEVIANRAIELYGGVLGSKEPIHPNDDVNKSQSTNDVFPSAMHIAAYKMIKKELLPTINQLRQQLKIKQKVFKNIVKIGRTHLQDAVPLTLGQEFSGYVAQLDICVEAINFALTQLKTLAIGGTAVGNGLNAPQNFDVEMAKEISNIVKIEFIPAQNKFAALASHEAIITTSSAMKNLAAALFKIADDIRWLASGPRAGLGELTLPKNEPGSSIMPGKINPTQCEMLTMISAEVIGNDAAITFAATQGKFELNAFKPVIIYNLLRSIKLLSAACHNFAKFAIKDLTANKNKIEGYVNNSLMLVTVLAPKIGYDKAAKIAEHAEKNNLSLREASIQSGYISEKEFDKVVNEAIKQLK